MKDAEYANHYARIFFQGVGWPEAEPVIMKDPQWAYLYAIDVLEDKWPEAEKYIMQDEFWWNRYTTEFPDAKR